MAFEKFHRFVDHVGLNEQQVARLHGLERHLRGCLPTLHLLHIFDAGAFSMLAENVASPMRMTSPAMPSDQVAAVAAKTFSTWKPILPPCVTGMRSSERSGISSAPSASTMLLSRTNTTRPPLARLATM